ncbi:Bug family tripartite tricarboxylate transporter substrate binding protein [Hydrogenophaga sp. BPS33]|uniref:Bug family tripartite tricarboxylate transporter substrate binding protein n=1 Tax=Hydrogenophaga sp. BPS33 TaxID=2651974 RepID=UPI00131FF027|nr:tripartite tricarboxylate transporter substrate-binding protein [Hydrogenophaga sp. BPS33]QHE86695.1 tripartite tricarboxylate transporter substrate binding protein [Hydrogenophaga sp. BPS33]
MNSKARTLSGLTCAVLSGAALLATVPVAAQAQNYPNRPITLLVGYVPGGPVDAAARIIQAPLQKRLGQPVVIENRGGASGALAAAAVAKAQPDGYTLFFAASATQTIAPHVQKSMPYDPLKDYTPVGLVLNAPNVLMVGTSLPIKSMQELTAYAKAHPDKTTFGSAGPGASNHLAGELLKKTTGAPMLHVPYKGNAAAMTDVMAGTLTFMFDAISTGAAAAAGKRVVPVAVTSAKRHPLLPNVPTMAEAGIANFVVGSFYALEGPPGLPANIVQTLNTALRDVLADPDVQKRMVDAGYEVTPSSADELAAKVKAEHARWGEVAKGLTFE